MKFDTLKIYPPSPRRRMRELEGKIRQLAVDHLGVQHYAALRNKALVAEIKGLNERIKIVEEENSILRKEVERLDIIMQGE